MDWGSKCVEAASLPLARGHIPRPPCAATEDFSTVGAAGGRALHKTRPAFAKGFGAAREGVASTFMRIDSRPPASYPSGQAKRDFD